MKPPIAWVESCFNELNKGWQFPPYISSLKKDSLNTFLETGFPLPSEEEWRYTNLSSVASTSYSLPTQKKTDLASLPAINFEAHRIVFINGEFSTDLSSNYTNLPLEVLPFSKSFEASNKSTIIEGHIGRYSLPTKSPITALNTALFKDGVLIRIPKDLKVDLPIHILFLSNSATDGSIITPRVLVISEPGSNATIIESHLGLSNVTSLTDAVTEVTMAENSSINYLRIQDESELTSHLSVVKFQLSRGSFLSAHQYSFGGSLARTDTEILLKESNAFASLTGLSILKGKQIIDNHTIIDHAAPHCESRELFKGIYSETSTGVFSGTIEVRKDAQKTNAFQSNQSILLSDKASINSKPQLRILADDVKCTHGATVGQIDENALFYLRSRGNSLEASRRMLLEAFATEVYGAITDKKLHEYIYKLILSKLSSL